MIQKIKGYGERAWEKIVHYAQGTYTYGYATLYGEERAAWIIKFTVLALMFGGISCPVPKFFVFFCWFVATAFERIYVDNNWMINVLYFLECFD